MSEGEIEVEAVSGYQVLPKEVTDEIGSIKLFNKWSYEDVEIRDISLTDYIQIRAPVYISHSAGRFAQKRFRKANCPIIERLTNSLMMNGRNNGKKLMAVRIVAHAFEIIHIMTDQNPIQVAVDAIVNCGPREDSTLEDPIISRVHFFAQLMLLLRWQLSFIQVWRIKVIWVEMPMRLRRWLGGSWGFK